MQIPTRKYLEWESASALLLSIISTYPSPSPPPPLSVSLPPRPSRNGGILWVGIQGSQENGTVTGRTISFWKILGRVLFGPDGMPGVVLWRLEALYCRVLIPPGTWRGLARNPPSLGLEPQTSCIWGPVLNQLRYRRHWAAFGWCYRLRKEMLISQNLLKG